MNKILKISSFIAFVLSVVISLSFFVIVIVYASSDDAVLTRILKQMRDNFGDLYAGVVGSLLSFSTLIYVILTFKEQKQQFNDNEDLAKQTRFESTFFAQLSMLYKVREKVAQDLSAASGNGIKNINDFYREFKSYANNRISKEENISRTLSVLDNSTILPTELERARETLGEIYDDFIKSSNYTIGFYYRYVFNIINFVIGQRSNCKDDKKYMNFIQAQMSNEEMALIFYDVISPYGLNKNHEYAFMEILDKKDFLENMDERFLLHPSHYKIFSHTHFRFLNRDKMSKVKS